MNCSMSMCCRKLLCVAIAFALLVIAGDSQAQKKKKKKGARLGEAVVHVLDSEGAPVGGAEVVLDIERPDGSRDRRLGLTGEDGAAHFRDVRGDCVQVRASVRAEGADVEGKPRPCGEQVEAFVVVPAIGAAPEAAPPEPEADEPVEEAEPAAPVDVDDDPYLEPTPEPPAPEPPPEIPPEEQPFELRAKLGLDFCAEMFYEPAEGQRTCDDTDVVGFGIELDAGFHFEEWLLVGALAGYRYFGSRSDNPEDNEEVKKEASNHLLMLGFQLRLSWMLENWVLAFEGVPVGISHQVIGLDDYQGSVNEFFITLTPSASYRVGEGSWVGVYVEVLQLMPWVDSANYRPATISAGVLFGTRLGPDPEVEGDGGDSEEEVESGDALMRRRLGDI